LWCEHHNFPPLQESAPPSLASAGVGLHTLWSSRSRLLSSSLWAGLDRNRLLTSVSRTGVGCSPLWLGQESDPCSRVWTGLSWSLVLCFSVWPGCRSLCSSVWTGCSGVSTGWSVLVDWSSAACFSGQLLVVLVVNSWLHWCLPQSVHHSAHLVCAPPAVLPDLLHLLWDSPLWQSTVRPFTSSVRPSVARSSFSSLPQFRWFPQFTTPVSVVSSVHSSVGHSSVDSLSRSLPVSTLPVCSVRSLSTRFILRFYDLASLYFY